MSLKGLGEKLTSPRGGGPVSPQFLSDVEKNRRIPSEDLLIQLATVLDIDISPLHALTAKALPEVTDYLSERPHLSLEIGRVFRRAKESGFTDWRRIELLIERKARKAKCSGEYAGARNGTELVLGTRRSRDTSSKDLNDPSN